MPSGDAQRAGWVKRRETEKVRAEQLARGDLILRELIATVDDRTTVVCLHAAGQIRRADEPFDTLAGQFADPPFHLNCRSLVMPWIPGMVDTQRTDANRELMDRPIEQRRIGPGGEIGGSIPPPVEGNPPIAGGPGRPSRAPVAPGGVHPIAATHEPPLSFDEWEPAEKWAEAAFGDVDLTETEREAVSRYGAGGYWNMNRSLRGLDIDPDSSGGLADVGKIDALRAVLGRVSTPRDLLTFRTVRLGDDWPGMRDRIASGVGAVIEDAGFMSTTMARATAAGRDDWDVWSIELTVPKGTNALYISNLTGGAFRHEAELLIQAGARWVINEVDTAGRRIIARLL